MTRRPTFYLIQDGDAGTLQALVSLDVVPWGFSRTRELIGELFHIFRCTLKSGLCLQDLLNLRKCQFVKITRYSLKHPYQDENQH